MWCVLQVWHWIIHREREKSASLLPFPFIKLILMMSRTHKSPLYGVELGAGAKKMWMIAITGFVALCFVMPKSFECTSCFATHIYLSRSIARFKSRLLHIFHLISRFISIISRRMCICGLNQELGSTITLHSLKNSLSLLNDVTNWLIPCLRWMNLYRIIFSLSFFLAYAAVRM